VILRLCGICALVLALGCGGGDASAPSSSSASTSTTIRPASTTSTTRAADVIVSVRLDRRTSDSATADFGAVVEQTLADERGWERAGFDIRIDPEAAYVIVLAEADVVDGLCLPYDTFGLYSCQNGPVVALNADRWRSATPEWTGDLATYRQMLVNHEVGHLLGRHHPPAPQCPVAGEPARVMAQQSTELDGCLPNPWPLPDEIGAAARHDEPLAPPYEP
jgi:hypothetical protein